jgi:hypothetical protein
VIAWYQSKRTGRRLAIKHYINAPNVYNNLLLANCWKSAKVFALLLGGKVRAVNEVDAL